MQYFIEEPIFFFSDRILLSRLKHSPHKSGFKNMFSNFIKTEDDTNGQGNDNVKVIYSCLEPNCYFFRPELVEVMLHDMREHFNLPLYQCKECFRRFTRPQFLQSHSMDHMAGHFICYLCEEEFEYKYQIKFHFELHAIRSHKCPKCHMSFLKEAQLSDHMVKEHRIRKKLIKISERHKYFEDEPPPKKVNDSVSLRIILTPQNTVKRRKKTIYDKIVWKLGNIINQDSAINRADRIDLCEPSEETQRIINEIVVIDQEKYRNFQENSRYRSYLESPIHMYMNENTPESMDTDDSFTKVSNTTNLDTFDFFSVQTLIEQSDDDDIDDNFFMLAEQDNDRNEKKGKGKKTKNDDRKISIRRDITEFQRNCNLILSNLPINPVQLIPSYETMFCLRTTAKHIRLWPFLDYSGPSRLPC